LRPTYPVIKSSNLKEKAMSSLAKHAAHIDVLVAEDDPVVRLAVRQLLEGEGYTCAEAEDGREAVEIARQCPPRLVLLDLMMPDVDGFTAAEQLRSDPRTREVPIHCLTALDFPAARRAAARSGCEAFLAKPFDVDGLLDVVRTTLHRGSNKARPWARRSATQRCS
jgi:CheY-like chemotaxis protein